MADKTDRFYEFGNYRIDVGKRLLYRDGIQVPLTPKVFDTLLVLVENNGRTVDKNELMHLLWQDSFVEESNLAENIRKLRKALNEAPGENRYIMTVPRGGYRFVSDVRGADDDEVETVVSEVTRSRVHIRTSGGQETDAGQPPIDVSALANDVHSSSPLLLPGKRSSRWPVIVGIALLAVLAVGAVLYLGYRRRTDAAFQKIKLTKLTTTGRVETAAMSPDGNSFVYATAENGLQSLWLKQTGDTSNAINIVEPAADEFLGAIFSPDGKYVYYLVARLNQTNDLYRVPVLGGASTNVIRDVDSIVSFSPDGKQLTFIRGFGKRVGSELIIANADGTGEKQVATLISTLRIAPVSEGPAWSPDGRYIACVVGVSDANGETVSVAAVRISDGEMRSLTQQKWQHADQLLWLADGSIAMVAAETDSAFSNQIWLIDYPDGAARQITNDLNDYRYVTATADGKNIAAVQADEQANLFVAPGSAPNDLVQISSTNYDGTGGVAWTPDGDIVYSAHTGNGQDLWRTTLDGKRTQRLTTSDNINYLPTVAADGRSVAFVSNRSGGHHIWIADVDGGHPRQLTNGKVERAPVFSRDGQSVFYRGFAKDGSVGIFRIPLAGGEPQRVIENIAGLPAVSPDGSKIACFYKQAPSDPLKLAIFSTDGGTPLQLFDMPIPSTIAWNPDGRSVAYDRTVNGVSNIFLQPLSGGPPAQLTNYKNGLIFGFAWSLDAKQLVVAQGKVTSDVVLISASK